MATTLRQRQTSPVTGEQVKKQLLREEEEKEISEGSKFIVPNYTVKQLLDAIPAHCFHRSALRSTGYVIYDFALIGALVYGYYHIDSFLARFDLTPVAWAAAKTALYLTYMMCAGIVGTGVWVLGHECGHQAYSSSKTINNGMGLFLHSLLLVPYHAWRISHGRHHAATGHLTRDEVFVPRTRQQLGIQDMKEEGEIMGFNVSEHRQNELREALEESPIMTLWNLFLHQVFGWPLYLIKNASGQLHYPKGTNHFTPSSIIFKARDAFHVLLSDFALVVVFGLLGYWSYKRSFTEMLLVYFIPYLWVNHWLVMITFLQHTDPVLPHYSANKWTFARGALATIDRKLMGPIGGWFLHGICETHVSHHISSKIPHYNAWEATDALKEFLGPHYYQTDENMFKSFYRCYRECLFVEDNQDIVFYKNARGLAQRVPVEEGGNISDSGVDMTEPK